MERRKYRKYRFMKVLAFILTVIVMWKLIGNVGSWPHRSRMRVIWRVCTKYVYS